MVLMCYDKPNGPPARSRVGQYATMDEALEGISLNRKLRKETFGGLMASASAELGPVTYVVWKATGWTQELVTA